MNQAVDISYVSLIFCLLLLVIPVVISAKLSLGIINSTLISALRMAIQLLLVGIFLTYIFRLNNPYANMLWFFVMIMFASGSVIKGAGLKMQYFMLPAILALIAANLSVLIYFNSVIVRLDNIFDAKYIIAIGGMLLGNSLRGNIIGIGEFYNDVKNEENRYFYYLSAGATKVEALMPFLRKSINSAMRPTIANMATMGIVSLPGMMTGQILGGSSPLVAIKYQIAIMIAIFVSSMLSICFAILFTLKSCFNGHGIVEKGIYKR